MESWMESNSQQFPQILNPFEKIQRSNKKKVSTPAKTSKKTNNLSNGQKKQSTKKKIFYEMDEISNTDNIGEQDQMIIKLYSKYPQNWSKIAQKMNSLSEHEIFTRYKELNKLRFSRSKKWTPQQDERLLSLAKILHYRWKQIASLFVGCTRDDCYLRYKQLSDSKLWKIEEQIKLLELYETHGNQWKLISQGFNHKRSQSSCINKFNKLKNINLKKQWSQEDCDRLQDSYDINNGDWKQIHKQFQGYSLKQIYFKFFSIMQKYGGHRQRNSERYKNNFIKKQIYEKQSYPLFLTENDTDFWTYYEDDVLLELLQQYSTNWELISRRFKKKRTIAQYQRRYSILRYIYSQHTQRKWTTQQDKRLIQQFEQCPFDWQTICKQFYRCRQEECYLRFRQLMTRNIQLRNKITKKYCSTDLIYEMRNNQHKVRQSVSSKLHDQIIENILEEVAIMIKIGSQIL